MSARLGSSMAVGGANSKLAPTGRWSEGQCAFGSPTRHASGSDSSADQTICAARTRQRMEESELNRAEEQRLRHRQRKQSCKLAYVSAPTCVAPSNAELHARPASNPLIS
eukprot:4479516-Pleurochrysis_carterae.AAC.3